MYERVIPQEKDAEQVLVVAAKTLFRHGLWQGFRDDNIGDIVQVISEKNEFLPRSVAEYNPNYKQIIPYVLIRHADLFFLVQRSEIGGDSRLRSLFSLGIGGHIRIEDVIDNNPIQWAKRELEEEVECGQGRYSVVGLINDDTNEVGQVHFGLVVAINLSEPKANLKASGEHQLARFATSSEIALHYEDLENWSKIVFDNFVRKV